MFKSAGTEHNSPTERTQLLAHDTSHNLLPEISESGVSGSAWKSMRSLGCIDGEGNLTCGAADVSRPFVRKRDGHSD